jgi:tetratricopeptide (TPR) repeat protein
MAMRKLVGVLFVGALLAAAPATAQTNNDMCGSAADSYTPQQVINACTALINGGGYSNNDLAILYSNRGNAFKRARDYRSALADQDRAITFNPSDGITYYNRGNTRYDMGDNAGALADYEIALSYEPNYLKALYQSGMANYNLGNYAQSIAFYNRALAAGANDADTYTGRGNAYTMSRQFPQAIADYDQAIRLGPNAAMHRYNRGVANDRGGNTQQAIADYTDALRLDANYASALGNRGNLRTQNGDVPGGIADLTAALAIRESAIDLHNRGHSYADQRDYTRAIADFDRGSQVDPNDHEFDNDRCWYRAMANTQLDVARAACDRGAVAFANAPTDLGNVLDSRGMVGLKQGRWQDAWADYDAAARADSSRASYPFGRGVAALRLGRTEEARTDFARAMALDAQVAGRYSGYGFPVDASLLPAQ